MGCAQKRKARQILCQALYQWSITGQSAPDILAQYLQDNAHIKYDQAYFELRLLDVVHRVAALDAQIAQVADRPMTDITPIELAVLRFSLYDLEYALDLPYRIVISEALHLVKRFGTQDGYRYVNAVLDVLAKIHRAAEKESDA